jgi:predicted nucleic acid-binding protein
VARFFLDANIFLYAVGGDGPHREGSRDVLAATGEGRLDAVTSSEVLQEILHVRGRRVGTDDAIRAVRAAAELVAEVLPVTREDVLDACLIIERHPKLGARDALHAAVMKNAGLTLLISIDSDFDVIKTVKRFSPSEALRLAR